MSGTSDNTSSALKISHNDTRHASFAPGDTIVGHVSRSLPVVSPLATVKITLCGRTKTKIVISRISGNENGHPKRDSSYHGRFAVVDEDALLQTLFTGPLHIAATAAGPAPDRSAWLFSIDIPRYCSPRKVTNSVPAAQSFLPVDAASIVTQPLPDSFVMEGQGSKREGTVEYFLKATFSYTHQGTSKSHEAILPIDIRARNPGPPIADFSLCHHKVPGSASSFRLLPGMESGDLSFSQKRQSMFGSSKIPKIAGQMEIGVPRILQLENPNPIPIMLRFVPNAKSAITTAKIVLKSLTLRITSRTDIQCDGTFQAYDAHDQTESVVAIWPPLGRTSSEPLYIPCTAEWPPLDLGFRIPNYLIKKSAKAVRGQLQPDFAIYNIKHAHSARFELVAGVAEQEMKMSVSGKLIILPPSETGPTSSTRAGGSVAETAEEPPPPFQGRSESWIRPPAEGDAPPPFSQT